MKIALILIPIIGFIAGTVFKHHDRFKDEIDHPVEEFTEQILDSYGYEVDFSADKKAEQCTEKKETPDCKSDQKKK